MAELTLTRYKLKNATIGELKVKKFSCMTLEDPVQEHKIYGETAIPAGKYRILYRKEGDMHRRYSKRFKNHKGMLWLQHVPGFEWVYIHIGNVPNDTQGCILVGRRLNIMLPEETASLLSSTDAYTELYEILATEEEHWLTIEEIN